MKTKRISKKVYAIVLKGHIGATFLWLGTAFTLDEAFETARKIAKSNAPYEYWTLLLQEYLTLEEVNSDEPIAKPPLLKIDPKIKKQQSKNDFMKRIIESGDILLLNENKKKFTASEIKFLEEQIKKYSKK